MSGGDQGWQVGDLALRIGDGWWNGHGEPSTGPRPGSVHRVISTYSLVGYLMLCFEEFGIKGYESGGFRKIGPHARDAEDDITIALLNGAPARTPEPQFAPQLEPTS